MKLYIMRHGEALNGSENPHRPLSLAGKAEVIKVASFLKQANSLPVIIWHSSKTRAMESGWCC